MKTWISIHFSVMHNTTDTPGEILSNADCGYVASEIHRKEIHLIIMS